MWIKLICLKKALIDGKAIYYSIRQWKSSFCGCQRGATHDATEIFGQLNINDRILLHANDEIKEGVALSLEK